jgi:phage terminase large subunit GpA-like protein
MATLNAVRDAQFRNTERKVDAEGWPLWRPPPRLTLAQWADTYRILSSESSAEPGQWVTAKAEYEREIMNAISDPGTPRVCVMKASQMGVTDCAILNMIGYHIHLDQCPILAVQPTTELAEAFSTDRFRPMIRDTPCLRDLVADPRSRDSMNTLRRVSFKGGFLALGGANSAASLSGRPVRVVLLDEADRFPASAGSEGNPLQLAIARCSAFFNRKIVIVSSPGIAGVSHIEREMEHSTKEFWFLPCPSCNFAQVLEWTRVRFSDYTHQCIECGLRAPKYRWLAGKGEWRASQTHDKLDRPIATRGFYLSGLYSPWIGWDLLGIEYARAHKAIEAGDAEPMKAFKNTRLGQLWQDIGQKVEIDLYRERREVYS